MYEQPWRVATYEVDGQSQMTMSAVLKIFQEVNEKHMAQFGLGYEFMKNEGFVFLIVRSKVNVSRMPAHTENLRVVTRPMGIIGAEFYREYKIYCKEELIIDASQSSVTADTHSHKILHPKMFNKFGLDLSPNGKIKNRLERISSEEYPKIGERTVKYSDLDYNTHLNNTKYADIISDCLSREMMGKTYVSQQINFINEANLGDKISLYEKEENGEYKIYGEHSRGRCFESVTVLKGI